MRRSASTAEVVGNVDGTIAVGLLLMFIVSSIIAFALSLFGLPFWRCVGAGTCALFVLSPLTGHMVDAIKAGLEEL